MALTKSELRELYRRRAPRYDFTANLYYLMGFREQRMRRRAVEALALGPGSTVVEIGCGTGLNFALLRDRIGDGGHLIGVDMTDAMLERATARIGRHDWANVELVRSEAGLYEFPPGIDAVISTFALTLVPEYDDVIRRGAAALAPGGRWAVADFKMASGTAARLAPLLLQTTKPFGVSLDLADRHPWESMERHLGNVSVDEVFFGFAYVAASRKQDS